MYIILGSDGKEYGPVTRGNVIEWIRDGRANLQTKARSGDDPAWRTLADFPEFVPTGSLPAFVPLPLAGDESEPMVAAVAAPTLPLAGLRRRLAAAMIDGALQWLCWMPASIAAVKIISEHIAAHETPTFEMVFKASTDSIGQSLPFLFVLAAVQVTLLCVRSQSVGKLVLGLRIVAVPDGTPAGPVRAYVLRGLLTWLLEQVPFIGKLYWLVDSFFIFREDQRCVHDLIAGTKVVKLP